MAYKRAPIEPLEKLVTSGQKKYVRYSEGAELYSMGIHAFTELAREANAVRKVRGVCLVNLDIINEYIEDMYG